MISASQVSNFEDCPRKWAWDKIMKVPRAESPSAVLGTATHRVIERYLRFHEPLPLDTPEGLIALTGAHYWPPPGEDGYRVEAEFRARIGGHAFIGIKDLDFDSEVWDHKTTSDFRWMKSPDDLINDVQATLYAHEGHRRGHASVGLRWIYYRTKPPYRTPARLSYVRVTPELIAPRLEKTKRSADLIELLRERQVHPLDLPPNIGACEKFGGCPFIERCNLSPIQKIEAHMMNMQDALSRISGQVAAQAGQVNPGTPQPPAPPAGVTIPAGSQLHPPAPAEPQFYLPPGGAEWLPIPVAAPPAANANAAPPAPPIPVAAVTPAPPIVVAGDVQVEAPKRGRGRGRPPGSKNKPAAEGGAPDAGADTFEAGIDPFLEGLGIMLRAVAARFFS